jgi:hypothetical protein
MHTGTRCAPPPGKQSKSALFSYGGFWPNKHFVTIAHKPADVGFIVLLLCLVAYLSLDEFAKMAAAVLCLLSIVILGAVVDK